MRVIFGGAEGDLLSAPTVFTPTVLFAGPESAA